MYFYRTLSIVLLVSTSLFVHGQDSTENIKEARKWMQGEAYDKAASVLLQAISEDSTILSYKKELFWCYYKQDKLPDALNLMLPILRSEKKDEQTFQLCGYAYRALNRMSACDSILTIALTFFPSSGPLHNDLGELYISQKKKQAIQVWEAGIRMDPNFAGNYFNAALYYLNNGNPYRGLLYAEEFVNFSPAGEKSIAVRKKMLETYKTIFSSIKTVPASEFNTPFGKKFITHFYKQEELSKRNLTIDDILMLRIRFLLDWFHDRNTVLPVQLYQKQQELLQQGLYVAYHQWLLGSVENPASYEQWKLMHADEQKQFEQYQKNKLFKIPPGQYYF